MAEHQQNTSMQGAAMVMIRSSTPCCRTALHELSEVSKTVSNSTSVADDPTLDWVVHARGFLGQQLCIHILLLTVQKQCCKSSTQASCG
jgi:hypothetical protein